jgi:hypothetical protein
MATDYGCGLYHAREVLWQRDHSDAQTTERGSCILAWLLSNNVGITFYDITAQRNVHLTWRVVTRYLYALTSRVGWGGDPDAP